MIKIEKIEVHENEVCCKVQGEPLKLWVANHKMLALNELDVKGAKVDLVEHNAVFDCYMLTKLLRQNR